MIEIKPYPNIIGIDLAGSAKRNTGFAYFYNNKINTGILHSDYEIINLAKGFDIIMIDAPLSIPKGRKDIDDKNGPHFRECDIMLRKLRIRFFPITLGPMRMLTKRGISIKNELEKLNKTVFETFPGAVYDKFQVERKNKLQIIQIYKKLNLPLEDKKYEQDELDAIACLIVGIFYYQNQAQILSGIDGTIVII